mgnify:CR=1 FL=1
MKNNKGFTIAELLVTFVLVMSIVLALFKVVDHYRERQQNATSVKEMNSYRNQIVKVVEDDILFNYGGIKEIKGLDKASLKDATTDFQQGIEITFNKLDAKDNPITKKLIVRKSGISYGEMFYEFPSKFVSAVDDVIYTETQVKKVNQIGEPLPPKEIYSIHIDLTHSELNRIFNINIVAVNNTPTNTDTTNETP